MIATTPLTTAPLSNCEQRSLDANSCLFQQSYQNCRSCRQQQATSSDCNTTTGEVLMLLHTAGLGIPAPFLPLSSLLAGQSCLKAVLLLSLQDCAEEQSSQQSSEVHQRLLSFPGLHKCFRIRSPGVVGSVICLKIEIGRRNNGQARDWQVSTVRI